ncbi:hypothetical protein J4Q44_G00161690 [Coregonus suidteri]|uniref:Ly6/PLAUR domain-containing protein 1-like n=1 Tax=Coregonus suidteri TaxID=861788 RepID=A0AAN8LQY3_9TELE
MRTAPMTPQTGLVHGFGLYCLLTLPLIFSHGEALQCYGCNILQGQRIVDVGCSSPEVITCSHSHKGFKHRFCIRTESSALGIVLTSGCATSRHCQQQELPGVLIHCCGSDLCNSTPHWSRTTLHWLCSVPTLLHIFWLQV